MRTVSYSVARRNLEAVLDKAVADRALVMITRQRGENVVLVSASEWTGVEETLHLMSSSPATGKHLLDGIARMNAGEGEEHALIATRRSSSTAKRRTSICSGKAKAVTP